MSMNRILLSILFICFTTTIFSQKNKVDPTDFAFAEKMKAAHEDSSVAALSSDIEVSFDFNTKSEKVEVIVKSVEVFVSLKPNINFAIGEFYDDYSSVRNIEVRNSKGKFININRADETYSQNGIFYSDSKICYFGVPFPTIGTRRKVSITKKYDDIRYFISEYLVDRYPMRSRNITINIPRWLNLEIKEMNFDNEKSKAIPNDKFDGKVISYFTKDVAPKVDEVDSKGPTHLYPHVLFLYQGYNYKGKTNLGLKTTKDLYTWYQHLTTGMKNDPSAVAALAKELTAEAATDTEKIKAIYYWVQENIRYIAFEDGIAGFQPDDCQEVFNKRYGDCKGMANLTKEMLKSIGFDARLTWIGTRRLSYDYSTPSLGVDNHMICAVKLNGEFIFLDATEDFGALGQYAERIQGRPVLIEDGTNFITSQIPVSPYSNNTSYTFRRLQLEEDKLVGTSRLELNGESQAQFLYHINNMKQDLREDALKYYLTDSDKSCKATDIQTSDFKQRDEVMTIDYNFEWKKGVSSFGDEIYLDLDLEKEYKSGLFDERKTDYLFNYKLHNVTEVEFKIPNGYTVSTLPENLKKEHTDFIFKVDYSQKDNTILYRKEIMIPNAEIKKENFEAWNKAVKDLTKQYKSQIALKKES